MANPLRKIIKYSAIVLVTIVLTITLALTYLLNAQDDIEKVAHLFETPGTNPPPKGAVTVQFLGNTNLLFSDGETTIMTDGWFTRPGSFETLFSNIAPDQEAIDSALRRAGVEELAAVIPVHSHYDHAMDSPVVAATTGADLIGSQSTLNIARGLNFDESRFKLVGERGEFSYGNFRIKLIKSRHVDLPEYLTGSGDLQQDVIDEPLTPPVSALDYKMGGAYSILIEHPRGTALVQGSAGYVEGLLDGMTADVVFLGIAGLIAQGEEYQEAYWMHVVEAVGTTKIYPIHWDSFTHPLGEEPELPNLFTDRILGMRVMDGIEWVERRAGERKKVRLLPMWEKVVVFDG